MRQVFIICLMILISYYFTYSQINSEGEKIFENRLLTRIIKEPTQQLKQHLNRTINKSNDFSGIDEIYIIDSLIAIDTGNQKLKCLFEYDGQGRIATMIGFTGFDNGLVISWKREYHYNPSNNKESEVIFEWVDSEWDTSKQILYEYTEENLLQKITLQDYYNNNWLNNSRVNYTYDTLGNEIIILNETWGNNMWNNNGIGYSYYNIEGNRRDSLLSQTWINNAWQNYARTYYFYNVLTNYLEIAIAELWTGNGYEKNLALRITNDELGNQIVHLIELWDGISWKYAERKTFTYIGYYFESAYCESWNGNNWEPGDNVITIKNPDGFQYSLFMYQSVNIYYIIVGVEPTQSNIPKGFSLFQNYPNPFNPSTTIRYEIPERGFVTIKIYDVLGNEIATLVDEEKPAGSYEVEFDATNLPSGVYFYTLSTGNFLSTKKMILLR